MLCFKKSFIWEPHSICNMRPLLFFFVMPGGGTPPPSQMTDELQRVGDIASHMSVRLPNPCDSDRCRHNAVPGGSQPSKSQCTPAVAALLSETQDRPLEQSAGMASSYFFIANVFGLLRSIFCNKNALHLLRWSYNAHICSVQYFSHFPNGVFVRPRCFHTVVAVLGKNKR